MSTALRYMPLWAIVSLLLITAVTFAPVTGFDFVNWDDPAYVWHNDLIQSWSPSNLLGIATETVTRNYAPLTIFSLLFDHTLWGMDARGYHLTSLLIHMMNGLLVYVLVRQLSEDALIAWITAALFLIHPVQTETVAWISSRKGLLSGTFMLSALIFRLRKEVRPRDEGWYIGLLIAALLSKALAVVIPPIVLLYDLWVRKERISDAIVRQFVPGLFALLLLLYTMGAQNSILGGVRGHMNLSLAHIMAIDVTLLWSYVGMLIWPQDLCVLYDPPTTGIAIQVFIGAAAWVVVAAFTWQTRHRQPLLLWMLCTWLLLLFPVLNFFRITTLMNDRYLYLPSIVVFAALATAVRFLAVRILAERDGLSRLIRPALSVIGCCCIAGAMLVTRNYLPVWQNSESLWAHARKHVPQLAVVHIQQALNLHDTGRIQEAITVLREAQTSCQADELDQRRIQKAIEDWTVELTALASTSDAALKSATIP